MCHGGMRCRACPGQFRLPPHPKWAQSFQDGSHPFDLCKLTFSTYCKSIHAHLRSKVQGLQHRGCVGSRTLLRWVSWAGRAAGQPVGRRLACLPKQVSPLHFAAWARAVWRHSTRHKQPISVGNLSFKWPGNESLEWGVEFSSSSCCLLVGSLQAVFRHFRNPRHVGLCQQAEASEKWRSYPFSHLQCPDIRGIWQWPCYGYELNSLIPHQSFN